MTTKITASCGSKEESPGNCMTCKEAITRDNDGVEINGGDFYQCNDCHKIETGYNLYVDLLYFHNKKTINHEN